MLSSEDVERIAEAVARRAAEHPAKCPLGWDPADIETLRDFATWWRSTRSTAWTTFVGVVVIGVAGVLLAGVIVKLKEMVQ